MSKIVPVILLAVVIGSFSYLTLTGPGGKVFFTSEYSNFLPASSTMVFAFNSPSNTLSKIDFEQYPNVSATMAQQSKFALGFDVTNLDNFKKSGIDLKKPAGFAMIDMMSRNTLAFVGVNDKAKFTEFFTKKILKGKKVTKKNINGVECMLQKGFLPNPKIYCFKDGYFISYSVDIFKKIDIETKFRKDILGTNNLSSNAVFKESINKLKNKGDMLFYMDYAKVIQIALAQANKMKNPAMENMMKFANDIESMALSMDLNGSKFLISTYMKIKENSKLLKMYETDDNCQDLLKRMPTNPLLCITSIMNAQGTWDFYKKQLNSTLSMIPQTKNMGDIDKIFAQAKQMLKQQFNIDIDIEKDIIKNIKGSSVVTLYDLPLAPTIDFNCVIATKLINPEKMKNILITISKAAKQRKLPVQGENRGQDLLYWVDLKQMMPQSEVTSTIGVVGNYLFIASKKETVDSIIDKQENLLESIKNKDIKKAFTTGSPNAGYISIGRLISQLANIVPGPQRQMLLEITKYTDKLGDLTWVSSVSKSGIQANMVLNATVNFLDEIFSMLEKKSKM